MKSKRRVRNNRQNRSKKYFGGSRNDGDKLNNDNPNYETTEEEEIIIEEETMPKEDTQETDDDDKDSEELERIDTELLEDNEDDKCNENDWFRCDKHRCRWDGPIFDGICLSKKLQVLDEDNIKLRNINIEKIAKYKSRISQLEKKNKGIIKTTLSKRTSTIKELNKLSKQDANLESRMKSANNVNTLKKAISERKTLRAKFYQLNKNRDDTEYKLMMLQLINRKI